MSRRSTHVLRSVSRLTAALFAVQMLVTGFCMLTPQAHAMPDMMQTAQVEAHCAKHHDMMSGHQTSEHSDECYHCDQPDGLANAAQLSVAKVPLLLPGIIMAPLAGEPLRMDVALMALRTPTGPPRSSTLIYHITQRIRV